MDPKNFNVFAFPDQRLRRGKMRITWTGSIWVLWSRGGIAYDTAADRESGVADLMNTARQYGRAVAGAH